MRIFEKMTLPAAIVISAVVIAFGLFAVQYNKQQSIEKQQIRELSEKNLIEVERTRQAQMQREKEYSAERKKDCLNIYKTESEKWNNVRGWRYEEDGDDCFIRYRDPNPKSEEKCNEEWPVGGDFNYIFFRQNSLCMEGEFESSF